ncbi:MAG: rod shape-determining protein RodA [Candidatus Omnitrophica bacterium]|jgi:rod shape determining protein RodA|nr:rod shape-determining protein RodA [Candidatus Omnitrophota bacterium]
MDNIFKKADSFLLIIGVILFIAFLALYSASYGPEGAAVRDYSTQQLMWMGIAVIALLLCVKFGYERCIDFGYIIFAANLLMLVSVFVLGDVRYGARRWIGLGVFSLQPSEFCKISFLLALTKYVSDNNENITDPKTILGAVILCLLPMGLIMKQPDLGTALIFLPVFFTILLVAGVRIKHLMMIVFLAAAGSPVLWSMLKLYQKKRLLVFMNPNIDPLGAGYTIIQSRIAVGSGGLFGKGWLSGTQNQLNFLPERHTDFIFSVIGEEWGFLGAAILLSLFLFLISRFLSIADAANDIRAKTLLSGIAVLIWMQVFINIAMTIGLMPVVGLPLPFISYGGSNLLTTMIMVGLAVSINMKHKMF